MMPTYQVILVAVDQSDQSDRAVAAARDLAQLSGGVVHVVHVRGKEVVRAKFGASFELETSEEVDALLAKEIAVLREADVKVTARVVHGPQQDTARAIVEVADEISADVIVMGSRGLSTFGALVVGSTTFKVLHAAKRPVLVVP